MKYVHPLPDPNRAILEMLKSIVRAWLDGENFKTLFAIRQTIHTGIRLGNMTRAAVETSQPSLLVQDRIFNILRSLYSNWFN